uniref:Ig-like domain-containing protein n=1 Tax=Lepisosteus oculatus TaxID=7918 RepID=W5MG83_LEPOC
RAEDKVTQSPGSLKVVEGEAAVLNCSYSTSDSSPYLFWYVQYSNDFPRYVLRRLASGYKENADKFKKRFDATLDKNTILLTIQKTEISDSALYYCALRPTVRIRQSTQYFKTNLKFEVSNV